MRITPIAKTFAAEIEDIDLRSPLDAGAAAATRADFARSSGVKSVKPSSPLENNRECSATRCASTGPPRDPVKPDGLVRHAPYGRAGAFVRPGRPFPPLALIASTGR